MSRDLFQNRPPVSAPAAQLKIARSFNCGLICQNEIQAPEGRREFLIPMFLPSLRDSNGFSTRYPALKRRSIFNRRFAAKILSPFGFSN
jgi:hypothetical protein